ncbi:hypothetical protein [Bacteroidetes bacterium endosymbiont of Geopemphigus sp.]|uniref:hypothetical protein n=1 Tax=Bacteroidetes bacterium endosymbiont of Geopemphigus sp. TaxID=2047937 RepID=UPI000CD08219|nr:hypothetical protein [Bacteroidetes bacterium endosymbiont of Geopemphigus sp.]
MDHVSNRTTHPTYEEMIIGKNSWTGEYEGAYNQFGIIIYLATAFAVVMILVLSAFWRVFSNAL